MIFKDNAEKILGLFTSPAEVTKKTNTLPILFDVLVQKKGGVLTVTGSDSSQEISMSSVIEDSVEEDFSFTLPAKKSLEILRSFSPDSEVKFSSKKVKDSQGKESEKITVQSGKSRFSLSTQDPASFPLIKEPESLLSEFSLTGKSIAEGLERVSFCSDPNSEKLFAQGISISFDGESALTFSGTNISSLARYRVELEGSQGTSPVEFVLPLKAATDLLRLSKKFKDELFQVQVSSTQVRFVSESYVINAKLLEAKFHNVDHIFNDERPNSYLLNKKTFDMNLKAATCLIDDKVKGISFGFKEDTLTITSRNSMAEDTHLEMFVDESSNGDSSVSLDARLMGGFLSVCTSDQFSMKIKAENSSVLFQETENPNYSFVLMPVRI